MLSAPDRDRSPVTFQEVGAVLVEPGVEAAEVALSAGIDRWPIENGSLIPDDLATQAPTKSDVRVLLAGMRWPVELRVLAFNTASIVKHTFSGEVLMSRTQLSGRYMCAIGSTTA
jgi:hypothetical protein